MTINNSPIILLQSGGRDSAIACVNLLKENNFIQAITFIISGERQTTVPILRAEELLAYNKNYAWAAIQYAEWENAIKNSLPESLATSLPRSCLVCAVAKITAVMKICVHIGTTKIAVGYTNYQNEWAEQTPPAVQLQAKCLEERGFEMLTPVASLSSKAAAIELLSENGLTTDALENPCCVSQLGTEYVSPKLIKEVIVRGFNFADSHEFTFPVLATIGHSLI